MVGTSFDDYKRQIDVIKGMPDIGAMRDEIALYPTIVTQEKIVCYYNLLKAVQKRFQYTSLLSEKDAEELFKKKDKTDNEMYLVIASFIQIEIDVCEEQEYKQLSNGRAFRTSNQQSFEVPFNYREPFKKFFSELGDDYPPIFLNEEMSNTFANILTAPDLSELEIKDKVKLICDTKLFAAIIMTIEKHLPKRIPRFLFDLYPFILTKDGKDLSSGNLKVSMTSHNNSPAKDSEGVLDRVERFMKSLKD